MNSFDYFIGIDQTGAVDSNGKPKKLQACLFHKKLDQFSFFTIDQISWHQLALKLPSDVKKHEVLILIDCVFGLPAQSFPWDKSFRDIIRMTKNFEFRKKHHDTTFKR